MGRDVRERFTAQSKWLSRPSLEFHQLSLKSSLSLSEEVSCQQLVFLGKHRAVNQSLISEECSAFSVKWCTGLCLTPTQDYLPPPNSTHQPPPLSLSPPPYFLCCCNIIQFGPFFVYALCFCSVPTISWKYPIHPIQSTYSLRCYIRLRRHYLYLYLYLYRFFFFCICNLCMHGKTDKQGVLSYSCATTAVYHKPATCFISSTLPLSHCIESQFW